MNRERLIQICCAATSLLLAGCGLLGRSASGPSTQVIELAQDAFVSGEKVPKALRKKGEKVELKDGAPVVVEWPGYRSSIIVPVSGQVDMMKVSLKPLEGAEASTAGISRQRVSAEFNRLIAKVNEVQWLSATKRTDVALKMLEDLESAYPDVTYLGFMKASLLLLRGDQKKAVAVLETALREFPENESGQKLYQKLAGAEMREKKRAPSTLLDDDLLDISSDNITPDTSSTPGAALPPLPKVESVPVPVPEAPKAASALPALLPPIAAPAPPLPEAPPAPVRPPPAFDPKSIGTDDPFGDDLDSPRSPSVPASEGKLPGYSK